MPRNPERKSSPVYWFFYLLFWPDTWRILMGIAASVLLAPLIAPPGLTPGGRVMLYLMLAAIGWAATGIPAGWIVSGLKKLLLGRAGR